MQQSKPMIGQFCYVTIHSMFAKFKAVCAIRLGVTWPKSIYAVRVCTHTLGVHSKFGPREKGVPHEQTNEQTNEQTPGASL